MKTYLPKFSSGAFLARMMRAFRNWNKVGRVQNTPLKETASQITSGWDYRPTKASRRHTAFQRSETDAPSLPIPDVSKDNDNVRIDDRWFEFGGDTSVDVDEVKATIEKTTMKASLSDDENAVSEYD